MDNILNCNSETRTVCEKRIKPMAAFRSSKCTATRDPWPCPEDSAPDRLPRGRRRQAAHAHCAVHDRRPNVDRPANIPGVRRFCRTPAHRKSPLSDWHRPVCVERWRSVVVAPKWWFLFGQHCIALSSVGCLHRITTNRLTVRATRSSSATVAILVRRPTDRLRMRFRPRRFKPIDGRLTHKHLHA